MGTPDFATPSLEALHNSKHEVVGVITAPDRPAGRGRQERPSAVKVKATELGLNILQPDKLKNPEFISELEALNADLFVVVAFRMLPEIVWSMPTEGCINLHASLLPDLRGAAPINWAILYGYKKTGISTFFIEKEIDTGHVINRKEVLIAANDNVGTLHDELMAAGSELLLETVDNIANGEANGVPQNELATGNERPAPKLFKPDGELDWNLPAEKVLNKIRGLSPYPAAWTTMVKDDGNKTLKIFSATKSGEQEFAAGEVRIVGIGKLLIGTGSVPIDILEVQLEGKRRMDTGQFLMGMQNKGKWRISK